MKKIVENNRKFILGLIVGLIISGSLVYASVMIQASQVTYNNEPLDEVLDDLYSQASAKKTVCIKLSGTSETVGAKYVCDLGENGISRNFYILKVNTDDVEMIMERNITDTVGSNTTMDWATAKAFFNTGNPGYSLKQTWLTKVKEVKLPDAQTIANAGGMNNGSTTNWDVNTATLDNWAYFGTNSQSDTSKIGSYLWLWDYTRDCSSNGCSNNLSSGYAYGYWTTDPVVNSNPASAWQVNNYGSLHRTPEDDTERRGVRPVIVLSKTNLAG